MSAQKCPHCGQSPCRWARTPCAVCNTYGCAGIGATQPVGGVLTDEAGQACRYPATERVSIAVLDHDGRLLRIEERDEPHPEAGQLVRSEWRFTHHDGYGPHGQPPHRREGLPDGFLLAGVLRQILTWLDHLERGDARGRTWTAHLRAIGAPAWMRRHATRAQQFLSVRSWTAEGYEGLPLAKVPRSERLTVPRHVRRAGRWGLVREAAARAIVAEVFMVDPGTIRRRIQNRRVGRQGL